MTASRRRLWIVTEPYYPEQTSTGYFLTGVAKCLARGREVGVICSMRAPSGGGDDPARREVHDGVTIHRAGPRLGKPRNLVLRSLAHAWMAVAIGWRALRLVGAGDEILVVTNPPFLPFIARAVARLRRAHLDLLVHDVYPEVLVVAGVIRGSGVVFRLLDVMTGRLYRGCRRIIALSEGMREVVTAKLAGAAVPVHVIPNWGDVERIRPKRREEVSLLRRLGLVDKFVVQYSGNIGRTHGVEQLLEVARLLGDSDPEVVFLVIGEGPRRAHSQEVAARLGLRNVRFLDRQPSGDFADSINACDLAVITLRAGMKGVSVPSRLYNLLAAGRPLLVIADPGCEPARVVERERLGWVVPPERPELGRDAIHAARRSPKVLAEMSQRARALAVREYAYDVVCERFGTLYW